MPRITFMPFGAIADVRPGTTVLDAARVVGIDILAPCAGRGTCGKCAVRVLEGDAGPADCGTGGPQAPAAIRLACVFRPESDITVRAVNGTLRVAVRDGASTPD